MNKNGANKIKHPLKKITINLKSNVFLDVYTQGSGIIRRGLEFSLTTIWYSLRILKNVAFGIGNCRDQAPGLLLLCDLELTD